MQDSFDKEIHPMCEEDLVYPDEMDEVFSGQEVREQRRRQKQFERDMRSKFKAMTR